MADDTIKQSLDEFSKTTKDLGRTINNLSTENGTLIKELGGFVAKDFEGITGSIKSGFQQIPGFNTLAGLGKTLSSKLFSAVKQKKEESLLRKRLGLTKEQFAQLKEQKRVNDSISSEREALKSATENLLGFDVDKFDIGTKSFVESITNTIDKSSKKQIETLRSLGEKRIRALEQSGEISSAQMDELLEQNNLQYDAMSGDEEAQSKLQAQQEEQTSILQGMLNTLSTPPKASPEEINERRVQSENTNALLENIGDGINGLDEKSPEKDKGGFFGGLMSSFLGIKSAIIAIPAVISGIVASITAFGAALAPLALPIVAVVGGIIAAIGFITGFMEGFDEGGIFGGLKEGMMKLFDWFVALPINILKDITVWALNALGMENLASALDAFPLVESLRAMFSFVVDAFVVPLGIVMDTVGGVLSSIFGGFMQQFNNLKNFFLDALGGIDDIFGGIMMIFSGDIVGGFTAILDGVKSLIMAPINLVVDTIKNIFGTLFGIISAPFIALKNALFYIVDSLYGLVQDIFSIAGIELPDFNLSEWFTEWFGGIVDFVKEKLAMLNPLSWFDGDDGDEEKKLTPEQQETKERQERIAELEEDLEGRYFTTSGRRADEEELARLKEEQAASSTASAEPSESTPTTSPSDIEETTPPVSGEQSESKQEPTVSVITKEGVKDLTAGEIKRGMDDRSIKRSLARDALRKLEMQEKVKQSQSTPTTSPSDIQGTGQTEDRDLGVGQEGDSRSLANARNRYRVFSSEPGFEGEAEAARLKVIELEKKERVDSASRLMTGQRTPTVPASQLESQPNVVPELTLSTQSVEMKTERTGQLVQTSNENAMAARTGMQPQQPVVVSAPQTNVSNTSNNTTTTTSVVNGDLAFRKVSTYDF